ncbi:MAG: amidohydrolase [Niallia nealsonii]|uniref:Amidohydrolase n=1 Tax=Niallia circulans TaxID=1397 RepID=A0A941JNJ8_NIACI|nr:amidohydrolase [Niallia circulans]MCB5238391.1 amidohydrolase [Niallia circulans]MDU1848036.1 amidohydrolase [Niallia nealsonii]
MGKLIYGGKIYTLKEEGHVVEAVFTDKQHIVDYGDKNYLEEKFAGSIVEKIDLKGDILLPGFVDSHMHLVGHGEKLLRLNLSTCTSKEQALKLLASYAKDIKEGEWIIGDGWNENMWPEQQALTFKDIDEYVPNHPVLLNRICKHAIAVNAYALKIANITNDTAVPFGGVIERDEAGNLTGVFKDQAQELITSILPKVTDDYVERALRAGIKDAYRLGLTGAHTEDLNYYHGYEGTYRSFKKVVEEEGNLFRAHLLVHHEVFEEMIQAGGKYLGGSEWVELGSMKIFADGAFGGRTALLSRPYHDDPSTNGVSIFTQEVLNRLVAKAREKEVPIAVHAIGDAAFEMVLEAIEKHPLQGFGRDRLIHATMLRKDLIERMRGLPLILDIQPSFVASDFPWVIDRLGKENLAYCYAWKTLLKEGLHCAGGSDAPIESANPLAGIQAAVTRSNDEDKRGVGYLPEEALTVYEAVCLYTKGSAYAICHEDNRGKIEKGYLADFTILNKDIFTINPQEIEKITVTKTIVGNEIMYERLPQ